MPSNENAAKVADESTEDESTEANGSEGSGEELDSDVESRSDVAFVLVAYDDAFALEEHRDDAVAFLERAVTAWDEAKKSHFRLDGVAWDALNETYPDIADYLMNTVETIRANEPEGADGLPDVEEIFSLGFGFAAKDDVADALRPIGRYYRLTVPATDPPSHEGLPLAFWAHLGAEGAAEVRASAIEQRLIELLEHRQDLIEDALVAIVDDGMVWELLASSDGELMEDALFDFLEEHWPGAAEPAARTEEVAPEVIAEFSLEREDGYLYFIDRDGDVARSKMAKQGEPAPDDEKVVECGIDRDEDWLYYIGPQGNVLRVPMYRAHDEDDD